MNHLGKKKKKSIRWHEEMSVFDRLQSGTSHISLLFMLISL